MSRIINGFWAINFIEYSQDQEIMYQFGSNILIFDWNKVSLPSYLDDYKNPLKEEGTWKVVQEEGQYFLIIENTENEFFAGKHKVCFKKDYKKKLITMIVHSDYLYFEANKGLFYFTKEHKTIDDFLCVE
jgi:hypothetical protein